MRQIKYSYLMSWTIHIFSLHRALTQPACKWDEIINVDAKECEDSKMDLPDIVIMTYAFFVSLKSEVEEETDGRKKKSNKLDKEKSKFKRAVSLLLSKETINSVIVDECSQLWEGHAVALFSKFDAATRFMLVGDDKQVPFCSTNLVIALFDLFTFFL